MEAIWDVSNPEDTKVRKNRRTLRNSQFINQIRISENHNRAATTRLTTNHDVRLPPRPTIDDLPGRPTARAAPEIMRAFRSDGKHLSPLESCPDRGRRAGSGYVGSGFIDSLL